MTQAPAVPRSKFRRFRAMACDIRIEVLDDGPADALDQALDGALDEALDEARRIFARVHAACTRFEASSPLMRANAAGRQWWSVPAECFEALREAAVAHELTDGLFDPRVLSELIRLGYDRSLPFRSGAVSLPAVPARNVPGQAVPELRQRWRPEFDEDRLAVRIGAEPVDLGGIGKGLAVRWAAAAISAALGAASAGDELPRMLIEAGGDCFVSGDGPDDDAWRVGVEDPRAPLVPGPERSPASQIAVLALRDTGCATSSVRVRTWQQGSARVHHLIDPRTGGSATADPLAVTVVHPDPARAEVWSKTLLIAGGDRVDRLAAEHDLAALWVRADGSLRTTSRMDPLVIWRSTP